MKTVITIVLLFFVYTLLAQNNGSLYIENPTVNGLKFSWEVHFTPTNTWSYPQSLGDCSWYFTYNPARLENPVLKFIASELSTAVYSNSTGISGEKYKLQLTLQLHLQNLELYLQQALNIIYIQLKWILPMQVCNHLLSGIKSIQDIQWT